MNPVGGVRRIKLAPHAMPNATTATEDLFVLAHLGVPQVDPERWSLAIDGLVGCSTTLTLGDLKARPKKVVEAVYQCCGSPLEPTVPTRRIPNVCWGGTDLTALLNEIEVDPRARFLWSFGLDGGISPSWDWFVKDLPLQRLAAGDILVNGSAFRCHGRRSNRARRYFRSARLK